MRQMPAKSWYAGAYLLSSSPFANIHAHISILVDTCMVSPPWCRRPRRKLTQKKSNGYDKVQSTQLLNEARGLWPKSVAETPNDKTVDAA